MEDLAGENPRRQKARRVFERYVRRLEAGEEVDFAALCNEHPDLEDSLRFLHSIRFGEDRIDTESFRDVVREKLGPGVLPDTASGGSGPPPRIELDPTGFLRRGEPVGSPRYTFEEKIAEGGMGVVLRVYDEHLKRPLAMKLLKRPGGPSSGPSSPSRTPEHTRFLAEAHVTAQLDHPGVIPIYDMGGDSDSITFFTMRQVRGQSLAEIFALIREEADDWNLPRAIGVLIRVCQAVAYAHSKGVVHRDLKPANLMVGRYGEVYVLDWGLAKVRGRGEAASRTSRSLTSAPRGSSDGEAPEHTVEIDSDSSLATLDGTVLGTPLYMPPEQARGQLEAVDERSDIYSLGAILYELLAGRAPYREPGARLGPRDLLGRVLEGPPRPPGELARGLPGELVAICEKAMARRPESRYQSALNLAEDLQAHLDHRVVQAHDTGALARLRKWAYRHRVALRAVSASAGLLAIAFVAFSWYARLSEANAALQEGEAHRTNEVALRERIDDLREAWIDARGTASPRAVWNSQAELDAHRALLEAQRALDNSFEKAVRALRHAADVAPPSATRRRARERLADIYRERRAAILDGAVFLESAEFYEGRLEDLGLASDVQRLESHQKIEFRTDPPGATAHCFRYEPGPEAAWLPLAFDASRGEVVGEPFLRVERIWDAAKHQSRFAVGDRWISVRGERVRLRGDVARALDDLSRDEPVEVVVERQGQRRTLDWVPFPGQLYGDDSPYRPGKLEHVLFQLGLTFEGYPLDFGDACRIRAQEGAAGLTVTLPRGSYLLVFRHPGHAETRLPLAVPWSADEITVRLAPRRRVPPGFLAVPAGSFFCGGDPRAFQSLEGLRREIPGFFMARTEVTVAEYLEFLNDPEIRARIDSRGTMEPLSGEVRKVLTRRGAKRLVVVPAGNSPYLARDDDTGEWEIPPSLARVLFAESPVPGVSQLAAREYAAWRSRTAKGEWRYRLPTDLEWEKAARGVDRRPFVWGDYLIWSFCWSGPMRAPDRERSHLPTAAALSPLDESVYGIRDLAGSVEEYTLGEVLPGFVSRRGGNWVSADEGNFRVANRNGRLVTESGRDAGFRLVAEIPEPAD